MPTGPSSYKGYPKNKQKTKIKTGGKKKGGKK